MGRPSTKERKPYNLDSIVDVAVRVFLRHGYDAASLERVAEAAGITKSSIYYHVAGKEDLLARALGRALDALFAVMDEPPAREGDALARLQYVVRRTVEVTTERLPEVALLLRVRGNTQTERDALRRRRDFDRKVAQIMTEAQARHQLRSDIDARLATRMVFGMLNSITEWYRPGGRLDAAEIAQAAIRIAFEGLK
ncbi:MAG: TetR/AcrR family transcriptional regulator [Candidatus Binataceae bacterium]